MATTKEDLRIKLKQLRADLVEAHKELSIKEATIVSYRNIVNELEERSDNAYKESEELLAMMEEATNNAEYNFNQFIEHTGKFTVSDAVYYMQVLHRTMQHFYDPKRNEPEL